jgi:hypothetical protein
MGGVGDIIFLKGGERARFKGRGRGLSFGESGVFKGTVA